MSAKANLLKYIEFCGIKKSDFYRTTGLSNGFLDKNANIASDKIEIIISSYPDLNLQWLITGKGEMLTKNSEDSYNNTEILADKNEIIATQRALIDSLQLRIRDLEKRPQKNQNSLTAAPSAATQKQTK